MRALVDRSAENIARDVNDTYPNITTEDATRIRDGLTALLTAEPGEVDRLKEEYKALHAELRKRYRKSGQ